MSTDLNRLCLHTITTKPWSLQQCATKYAAAGVKGITVWRDCAQAHPEGIKAAGELCRNEGLDIISYVRGGFFPSVEAENRQKAIDDNKQMIDEAAELGAPLIVLVVGADPKQTLQTSREQIVEGMQAVLDHAKAANVKLGIEPLHPMYADTRSAINDLRTTNDIVEQVNHSHLGVVYDVYHLWWDPRLEEETRRCGELGKLFAFHVCDWRVPTEDFLLDRGLMGEGCIRIPEIRKWVEDAGFNGYNEVEIFSNRHWARDQDEYLQDIIKAYEEYV